MKFCSACGARVQLKTPRDDDRPRFVCPRCGTVHYRNPLVVVGCIPEWRGRLLFCRRAIEPGRGKWTLPAGYLEIGETVEDGTRRELMEEAGAAVLGLEPYGLYNIPHIGQVYLIFRGVLESSSCEAGRESLEVRFFDPADIPWEGLAFTVIEAVLRRYRKDESSGAFPFHMDTLPPVAAG